MREKYRTLSLMAVVFKVMAWISLIAGLIGSIAFLMQFSLLSQQLGTALPAIAGFTFFVVFVVYTLLSFGSLYAISEGIYLLFDIEKETRNTKDKVSEIRPAA